MLHPSKSLGKGLPLIVGQGAPDGPQFRGNLCRIVVNCAGFCAKRDSAIVASAFVAITYGIRFESLPIRFPCTPVVLSAG